MSDRRIFCAVTRDGITVAKVATGAESYREATQLLRDAIKPGAAPEGFYVEQSSWEREHARCRRDPFGQRACRWAGCPETGRPA